VGLAAAFGAGFLVEGRGFLATGLACGFDGTGFLATTFAAGLTCFLGFAFAPVGLEALVGRV
jgi:hypothetical protein